MKKYNAAIAAVCAALICCSCGSRDNGSGGSASGGGINGGVGAQTTVTKINTDRMTRQPDTVEPVQGETVQPEPVQGETLSTEKIGYGQGVQFDDKNRPQAALDFNNCYGKYNAQAIRENEKSILLTFDQGYENGLTAQILDTLKEKKVKAVFFILKDYAERNPQLVQRMIDEGHIVGNHSVSHLSMPELSPEECAEEINGMQQYMKEKFGYDMTLFRPPMGEFSEQSLKITADCGCRTMLWSFAYADWDTQSQPDPAESLKKLNERAHEGAIYLLHSVSQTNADILGDFIDQTRKNGFEFEKLT